MNIISQRDPRWGFKPIGKSTTLIKDKGCLITCISMLSDYFKCYHDPSWMSKNLSFLRDLLIWNSIGKVLCFEFTWRGYRYDENKILAALKNPKTACVLQVRGYHWVVGIRKVIGLGYWVADPWDAKRRFYPVSSITGYATLKSK